MGLFQVLKQRWSSHTTLSEIADEIADRSIDAVWQRVQCQIVTLAPAESRGYVRARGVAIVHSQLAAAATRHEVVKQLRPRLYALTVEAVIQRIQERVRENRVREDSGRPQLRRVA